MNSESDVFLAMWRLFSPATFLISRILQIFCGRLIHCYLFTYKYNCRNVYMYTPKNDQLFQYLISLICCSSFLKSMISLLISGVSYITPPPPPPPTVPSNTFAQRNTPYLNDFTSLSRTSIVARFFKQLKSMLCPSVLVSVQSAQRRDCSSCSKHVWYLDKCVVDRLSGSYFNN